MSGHSNLPNSEATAFAANAIMAAKFDMPAWMKLEVGGWLEDAYKAGWVDHERSAEPCANCGEPGKHNAIRLNGREVCVSLESPVDDAPQGGYDCPICGRDTPHRHSGSEIVEGRIQQSEDSESLRRENQALSEQLDAALRDYRELQSRMKQALRFPSPAEAEKMPKCANCGHIDPEHGFNGPCEADWGKCPCKRFVEPNRSVATTTANNPKATVATFSDNPLAYEQARLHRVLEFRDHLAFNVGRAGLGDMYDTVIDGLDKALDGDDE